MSDLLGGFLSNDSTFGKIMTRAWVLIVANILFVFCTIPVVTIGPGFAALHYTIMKMLRGDGDISPFSTFWKGLKENFKQSAILWIVLLGLFAFLRLEWFWCGQFGGIFLMFRIGLGAVGISLFVTELYAFPTMAAFEAGFRELLKDSIFFAFRKPVYLVVILLINIGPILYTFINIDLLPLYAFIWVTCGFSLVCLVTDSLLLKEYEPYLPEVDEYGNRG